MSLLTVSKAFSVQKLILTSQLLPTNDYMYFHFIDEQTVPHKNRLAQTGGRKEENRFC